MYIDRRVTFSTNDDLIKKIDLHVKNNQEKYIDRSQFINTALNNLYEKDYEKNLDERINYLEKDIKKLKSLLELNLQFTYSMMERQELKVSNLYYGDSLRAIKGKEAIDGHYRNNLMNENKIQTKNNVVEENKNINRITIDDL